MRYLLVIAMAQGFIAAFLLWRDFRKHDASRYLLFLILLIASHLGIKFLLYVLFEDHVLFDHLVTSFSLGTGPLLYFYVVSESEKKSLSRKTRFLHLMPLILFSMVYITLVAMMIVELNMSVLLTYKKLTSLAVILSNTLYLSYLIHYILFSSRGAKVNSIQWLKYPLLVSLSPFILAFLSFGIAIHTDYIRGIGAMSAFYMVVSILRHNFSKKEDPTSAAPAEPQYQKSSLSMQQALQHVADLKELMEKDRLYLKKDLTLEELAEKLDTPKHHLTQSLNTQLHKNFYQFLNEYRVHDACSKLEQGYEDNLLQLAYSSGFNSKTTFNTYFKKCTGKTPAEFRKLTFNPVY